MSDTAIARAQAEIVDAILAIVRDNAWDTISVVTVVVDAVSSSQVIASVGEGTVVGSLPRELRKQIRSLKEAMVHPERGAWLSVRIHVSSDGSSTIDFDYDRRPYLNGPLEGDWFDASRQNPGTVPLPSDNAYAVDLARFPRRPDLIPDWYPTK